MHFYKGNDMLEATVKFLMNLCTMIVLTDKIINAMI